MYENALDNYVEKNYYVKNKKKIQERERERGIEEGERNVWNEKRKILKNQWK